jgi:F0F1-type ATP synthase membrane subunit b/b'
MITTETLFFTQIASLVAFVGALFFLYRVLVEQKEATIQTQKENITYLKDQLTDARSRSPDVLAQNLAGRIKLFEQELEQMARTNTSTQSQVDAVEAELHRTREEAAQLATELVRARALLESVCPVCGAPLRELSYIYGTQAGKRDPIPHEHVVFECGREEIDRDTWTKCGEGERKAGKK